MADNDRCTSCGATGAMIEDKTEALGADLHGWRCRKCNTLRVTRVVNGGTRNVGGVG